MAATDRWIAGRRDLVAGLTVAAIAVPQAMAYALIAGLDPRIGLNSAIVVTAVAAVFGSSAHLINGPTNAISLVVFAALANVEVRTPSDALEAVFLLSAMVGGIQLLIAVFKIGDLTRYISESVVYGFMAGAGFLVALTQIGNLTGLKDSGTGHQHILHRLWLTMSTGGPANPRALAIGLVTVAVVLLLRRFTRKHDLPRVDMLAALIIASAIAAAAGWSQAPAGGKPAVAVIGDVPPTLPEPHVPQIERAWISQLGGSSLAIAMLGLLEALAISKSIAQHTRQRIDFNRQCYAEGIANLVGGFFQCMPGSGSLTRSAINFHAGAVTRWSGVIAATAVAMVVLLFAPWARYIPKASLAGLLMVTAAGLVDRHRLAHALRTSRYDAWLVVATAGAAVFWSVEYSILIGVGLSILMFVPRAARLQGAELAVSPGGMLRPRQPSDPPCTRLVILDLEGEFFFGASPELDRYFDRLRDQANGGVKAIVLRVKRTRNPDMVCMERVEHFVKEMRERGVLVLLAGVRADFDHAMHNLKFHEWLSSEHVFRENPAVEGTATLAAVRYAYRWLGDDVCEDCPRRDSR